MQITFCPKRWYSTTLSMQISIVSPCLHFAGCLSWSEHLQEDQGDSVARGAVVALVDRASDL